MQINSPGYCFVSLYQSYPSYHGASDITYNFFNSWPNKNKKLFQITSSKFKKKKIFNISNKFGFFGNLYNLFSITYHIKKYFNKYRKKVLIIEGASWAGYIYFLTNLCKIFIKDVIIIYHAHNLEYEVRKLKNNFFISYITFFLEKHIYKNYIGTCVSAKDYNFILKNYGIKPILFENGIINFKEEPVLNKKLNKKKFILFCGSYSYWPNKIAIDTIIKQRKIFENIYPNIKFVFTGEGINNFKYKNFLNLGIVKKTNLVWLIKNCLLFYAPMPKAPGTKLKIIEAIYHGAKVICSKHALVGIKNIKNMNSIIITSENKLKYNLNQMKKIKIKENKIKDLKMFRKHYDLNKKTINFYEKINKLL